MFGAEKGSGKHKGSDPALFRDPDDGKFDVSGWLSSRYGFLPVPIIITGPTFGAGGGVNLLYMHGKLAGRVAPNGHRVPPNITGVAAIATENGSRAAGAYNLGYWKNDRLRTTTFLGRPNLNLDFYPDVLGNELTVKMNLSGWTFFEEVKWRLGKSSFFVGGNYVYSTSTSSPVDQGGPVIDELLQRDYTIGGLGAAMVYDTRNTIFTPTRGTFAKVVAATHAGWLGSGYDYPSFRGQLLKYLRLSRIFDLGLRAEAQSVGSSAPYFIYPSVQIRGIANKRYQGQHVVVGEFQLNWRVYDRWRAIGFFGSGKAFGDNKLKQHTSFSEAAWRSSKGLGFRYEIARQYGMQVGVDYAWGPDDTAFYITVGSAWNSFY
ncbi:MAG: BamA/TamA family outer membrane protein [Gemmatimonadales bacterium]